MYLCAKFQITPVMILKELHKLSVFHKSDVLSLTGNENSAKELLRRYKKTGLIVQIKRDFYAVTDLANQATTANKFEIASNVSPTSHLAYHTAIAYHGLATQIFNRIYVADSKRFRNFEFEGIDYFFCESKISEGIVNPPFNSLVHVTDLERTIIDCIDNTGLAGGLEELVLALALVTLVKENLLLKYLQAYNKQVLYQKAGFVLSYFDNLRLSEVFFKECKSKIGKGINFLTSDGDSTVFLKNGNCTLPKIFCHF
jgi:predicted transcriptional regulator of viral defense system